MSPKAEQSKGQEYGDPHPKILLVEDEASVRRLARHILSEEGFDVTEAGCGDEALEFVRRTGTHFSVLVTDVIMPGMNGRDLAQRLREIQPGLAVLFMSGYADDVLVTSELEHFDSEFLQKPFAPAILAEKTRKLAQGKAAKVVLVVDDEEPIRRLLGYILQDEGYDVVLCADGAAAEETVLQNHVDLVITDLVMPGQEGLETIQALRKKRPELKIVAISGAFDGAFLRAAKLMGACSTMRKPLTADEVVKAVRQAIGAPYSSANPSFNA
jgi:DNA-binding NtrC family response regulator